MFAQDCIVEQVIFLDHSVEHERSWHTLLTDIGPVLCGVWYRPPCAGEVASIHGCENEWKGFVDKHVASVLVGDMNVHHIPWLRHSSSTSVEGTALYRFCSGNGLAQFVKRPTRNEYLLDLFISDITPQRTEILPAVSDHNMVLVELCVGVTDSNVVMRTVLDYSKANWDNIRKDFDTWNWRPMDAMTVDDAERFFHNTVFHVLERHIPVRDISIRKTLHPWINDRCLAAVRTKNSAAGTASFLDETQRCNGVLFEEYVAYVKRMRDKLQTEKRGSKAWWKLANQIMDKDAGTAPIPALQTTTGCWVNEPSAKADMLADHFASKFVVPELEVNEYSSDWLPQQWDGFVLIRRAHAVKILSKLDVCSGTGPDGLSTRVLRTCARELGRPVAKLVRRIIACGQWPTAWSLHWMMPLHKRKSKSNPANY